MAEYAGIWKDAFPDGISSVEILRCNRAGWDYEDYIALRDSGIDPEDLAGIVAEINRLRAKCNRLIRAVSRHRKTLIDMDVYRLINAHDGDVTPQAIEHQATDAATRLDREEALHDGDLTPEPSEPPVSHGERNDTKSPKSITSAEVGVMGSTSLPLHPVTVEVDGDGWRYSGGDPEQTMPPDLFEILDGGWWRYVPAGTVIQESPDVVAAIQKVRPDYKNETENDHFYWFRNGSREYCHAGDWIVITDDGDMIAADARRTRQRESAP